MEIPKCCKAFRFHVSGIRIQVGAVVGDRGSFRVNSGFKGVWHLKLGCSCKFSGRRSFQS